jgi:hypothetical protein
MVCSLSSVQVGQIIERFDAPAAAFAAWTALCWMRWSHYAERRRGRKTEYLRMRNRNFRMFMGGHPGAQENACWLSAGRNPGCGSVDFLYIFRIDELTKNT